MSGIRDTLSTSAPELFSNHRVEFQIDTDIPAGGYITIRPESGAFTIPTSTFSHRNVELYVSNGGPYTLRSATATPDAIDDGISIVDGTAGEVTITLNSTTGISAGSDIRILIGSNTSAATSTDTGWQNPTTPGTYSIYLDVGGGEGANAQTMVAIIDQVGVGPIDTRETIAPIRFNGAPTGTLSFSTLGVDLSLSTDELAVCRYSLDPNIDYNSMSLEFEDTGLVVHVQEISGLTFNTTYSYYVRCIDDEGNFNTDDYVITFTVDDIPTGNPGTGSTTNGDGTGQGSGTGNTGTGSGSSNGSSGGSGSGGSGGGGGSNTGDDDRVDGGGGFESNAKPYASGDARVIVTGYAFPGSTVTVLVDGFAAETARATGQGRFEVTIDAIARGVYTFGVYATDSAGTRSSTFSTSFSVIGARTSNLSNIHIMPTIKVTPNPVEPGANVNFSGYAIPNSTVDIEAQPEKSSAGRRTFTATSDANGRWAVDVNTTGFSRDTWKVRAKSTNSGLGISSQYSNYTFFGVGVAAPTGNNSDLNRDGKVNLIDFSILLFHWNTNGGASNPPADINRDGRVSLTDFSIMIFNWTG